MGQQILPGRALPELDGQPRLVGDQVDQVDGIALRPAVAGEIERRPVLLVTDGDGPVLFYPAALGLVQRQQCLRTRRDANQLQRAQQQEPYSRYPVHTCPIILLD